MRNMGFYINPCAAELFVSIFHIFHSFELELLTQIANAMKIILFLKNRHPPN